MTSKKSSRIRPSSGTRINIRLSWRLDRRVIPSLHLRLQECRIFLRRRIFREDERRKLIFCNRANNSSNNNNNKVATTASIDTKERGQGHLAGGEITKRGIDFINCFTPTSISCPLRWNFALQKSFSKVGHRTQAVRRRALASLWNIPPRGQFIKLKNHFWQLNCYFLAF